MIQGDLLSAFPHRQFYTLPGLLDSWAALPNSKPNACMPMQRGSLYHFYDGLWYDPFRQDKHIFSPNVRGTSKKLNASIIFLDKDKLFGNRTSKNFDVLARGTSENF